jgi:hypothetical protein
MSASETHPSLKRTDETSHAMPPVRKRFVLTASVSSDNPSLVRPVLERALGGRGEIKSVPGGFEVRGEFEGENARDLNRDLLSQMRRAEKRTRLRSEWSSGSTAEKFFDYVPKGTRKTKVE